MGSSLQSWLFDRLLEYRVSNGTWDTVVVGDLVKTLDRGGLFVSEDAERDSGRALAGEVTATGPIFGPRMRWPEGDPMKWEMDVLEAAVGGENPLEMFAKVGAGSRRALRLLPRSMGFGFVFGEGSGKTLEISMELSKGAYATTVLGSVFALCDAGVSVVGDGGGDCAKEEELVDGMCSDD